MSLDVDFRIKLSLLAGTAVPVQQNYLSTDKVQPRIWYQRSADDNDLFICGIAGQRETTYDVEVNGMDPDATAAIYDRLTANVSEGGLDGFRGPMGNTRVLGLFIGDASDDYEPRGLDLDDGYHIFSFQARVIT